MKTTLTTLFLLIASSFCFAQNYQPFNDSTPKRFFASGTPVDNDYFFYSTSSISSGDTIILNQYYKLFDNGITNPVPQCPFWGGPIGVTTDTTWLGTQIKWNSTTKELFLRNRTNHLLSFDFNLPLGSEASFYLSGPIEYRIEHTFDALETFYGVSDSVQFFEIQAYDSLGVSTSSSLNNFEIKLSKNYGLISFINCFDLPSIEQTVNLEGQVSPNIGHYQLTYDDCYPWIASDVIQYSTNNYIPSPFTNNKVAYQTLVVTNRIETVDSVKIEFTSTLQEPNPSNMAPPYVLYGSAGSILFKKGTSVSERPWNMNQLDFKLSLGYEYSIDWCGLTDSFGSDEEFAGFCDSCSCYGGYDGFGQSVKEVQFAVGLGMFRISYKNYGYPTNGGSSTGQVIYSNVNGVECGTFWNSIDEIPLFNLSVSPNPTKDKLTVESDQILEAINVFDLSGRLIFKREDIQLKTAEISLASFKKGAYILEVSVDGSIQTQTIIRE